MKKHKEGAIYCGRCDKEMKIVTLPSYEYADGILLENVECNKCFNCSNLVFTEEQAEKMERRTKRIERETFALERKLTVSRKCITLNLPADIVRQLKLSKGQKVNIKPLSAKKILLEFA